MDQVQLAAIVAVLDGPVGDRLLIDLTYLLKKVARTPHIDAELWAEELDILSRAGLVDMEVDKWGERAFVTLRGARG